MKNLMRIMSIFILFISIIFVTVTIFDVGTDFNMFALKIIAIFIANIMSFVSLAACAYCLERNDTNYLIRIIPIYVSIPIILSIIAVFFNINDDFITKALEFFIATSASISLFSITMIIRSNNQITSIIKYIAIFSIVISGIINVINEFDETTISFASLNSNFNLFSSSIGNFNNIKDLIHSVSIIVEIFSILLLFTTNYAFGSTVELEDGDIDYEAVKKDAMKAVDKQMNERYNLNPQIDTLNKPLNNNTGLMNINNQLGVNSNVGTVKGQAREVNVQESIDSIMSFSTGPVMNNTINEKKANNIVNNESNANIQKEEIKENVNMMQNSQLGQTNQLIQNDINQQQQQINNNIQSNVQQPNNNINNQIPNPFLNTNTDNTNQNKFLN